MRSTIVDENGDVRCPNCGARNSFRHKRSGIAKLLLLPTVGIALLFVPKRLKCNGRGALLKAARANRSTRPEYTLSSTSPGRRAP